MSWSCKSRSGDRRIVRPRLSCTVVTGDRSIAELSELSPGRIEPVADRRDHGPFSQSTRPPEDRPRRPDPFARLIGPSRAGRRLSAALVAGLALVLVGWLILRL